MKITIAIIFIVLSSISYSQSNIEIGIWKPKIAKDEFGDNCSNKIINDFEIEFLKDGKYIRQNFNYNGPNPLESNGNYYINSDTLVLDFKVGVSTIENKFPIFKWESDLIILDYNICPKRDSVSHVKLELIKIK